MKIMAKDVATFVKGERTGYKVIIAGKKYFFCVSDDAFTKQGALDEIQKRLDASLNTVKSCITKEQVKKFFDDIAPILSNLYSRWLDEHEYEDILDYKKVIAKNMPDGFSVLNMTKRPFGFQFDVGTDVIYHCKCTRNQITMTGTKK